MKLESKRDFSIVGVDVGGTSICVGLIKGDVVVEYYEASTDAFRNSEEILNTTICLIQRAIKSDTIGIGVGVPGLVDVNEGIIYNINNIPSWRNYPLRSRLYDEFKIPVFINNDANCFALGEFFFGKGKGFKSMVAVTIGTGLGSGIVVNGRLHTGILGCAGEIGGMPYKDSDFESYCSSKFFEQVFSKSGYELSVLAEKGDSFALSAFDEFGVHLGFMLKSILFLIAPEVIVIGGSISRSSIFFGKSLLSEFNEFPYKPILERSHIEFSNLNNSAILGAAALVLNEDL